MNALDQDPKNNNIGFIITFIVIFAVGLMIFIFVSTLSGSMYASLAPQIEEMDTTQGTSGDVFISLTNESVALDHASILNTTFQVYIIK